MAQEVRLRMTLFVAVVVAFVVLVVGVATDYWGQSKRTTAIHYGLWKGCGAIGVSDQSPIRCFSPEDKRVSDWKRASRAFMVLSCLVFGVAIGYVLLLQMKPKLPSVLLAFILAISFLCSVTGVAVYTTRSGILQVPGLEFGFSYMLVWGGIGLNAVAMLLSCCDQAGYHFF
ncbi:uncharacterized protein LOC135688007 [Rhopilema esculentum]|uniref:uncharacterized protein LOC135688007 n=1 Tax=Rhopilema esculentum TaxID=499914 RepID=UPI0031D5EE6C